MILLLGDIHGNFEFFKNKIQKFDITDCSIIQVGDFGMGFREKPYDEAILENLNSFLSQRNITMSAIRGNHDDPAFFDGSYKFSNLALLEDYTVLDIEGTNFLCIGGAVSVDRMTRIHKGLVYGSKGYWENEGIVFDENKVSSMRNIDVLITHTAPSFCDPNNENGFGDFVYNLALNDSTLIKDLIEERTLMTKIWDMLCVNNQIHQHFYGHFHRSNVEQVGDCVHRLLDIDELFEFRDNKN